SGAASSFVARIQATHEDVTTGTEDSSLSFWSIANGGAVELLSLDGATDAAQFNAGSAAAPSLNFGLASDSDTGFYQKASNIWGIAAEGTRVLEGNKNIIEHFSARTGADDDMFRWYSEYSGSPNQVAEVRADGDIYNDNGTYGTLSDPRLKRDRTPARSYWSDFASIPIESYTLDKTGRRLLNPPGDAVAAVFPSLVKGGSDPETDPYVVKTSVLFGAVQARVVQEAQERIEALEARVKQLEAA
ncbi:MAG: hypothetical protein R3324_06385, partial [Halobacteriales archaeon]|nr:hypothetical protein [Halobacteriales archaeon]